MWKHARKTPYAEYDGITALSQLDGRQTSQNKTNPFTDDKQEQ